MRIAIHAVGRMKAGPEKELADRYFDRFAKAGPAVGPACRAVAAAGFHFGALLPEYTASGDVLRLQRPTHGFATPNLEYEQARELLAYSLRT